MKISRIFTLLALSLISVEGAKAEPFSQNFRAGQFDFQLETHFFSSKSNFNSDGSKQELPAGSSLQAIELKNEISYGLSEDWRVSTLLEFNNIDASNAIQKRTNSILTHLGAELAWKLFKTNNWFMLAKLGLKKGTEEIDINGDNSIASDGADEIIIKDLVQFDLENWTLMAEAGVRSRTEGLSALFDYSFNVAYHFEQLSLGSKLIGFTSIKDDDQTSTPVLRDILLNRVNAGSKKYFALNPNSTELHLLVGYQLDKNLEFGALVGTTIVGSNSADGFLVGGVVNWSFGSLRSQSQIKALPNDENSIMEPGFKVDTNDGVNQDLFKNTPPKDIKKKK